MFWKPSHTYARSRGGWKRLELSTRPQEIPLSIIYFFFSIFLTQCCIELLVYGRHNVHFFYSFCDWHGHEEIWCWIPKVPNSMLCWAIGVFYYCFHVYPVMGYLDYSSLSSFIWGKFHLVTNFILACQVCECFFFFFKKNKICYFITRFENLVGLFLGVFINIRFGRSSLVDRISILSDFRISGYFRLDIENFRIRYGSKIIFEYPKTTEILKFLEFWIFDPKYLIQDWISNYSTRSLFQEIFLWKFLFFFSFWLSNPIRNFGYTIFLGRIHIIFFPIRNFKSDYWNEYAEFYW